MVRYDRKGVLERGLRTVRYHCNRIVNNKGDCEWVLEHRNRTVDGKILS
jgi:hypothetical protein